MTRTEYKINFNFEYSPIDHKGAPYSVDGEHWFNHGELCEIADKAVKGLPAIKEANSAYDVASDIKETQTSIKSSGATLVNRVLGYDFDSVMDVYFHTCHSDNWDFVIMVNEEVIIYNMNKEEFQNFLKNFSYFDKDRKVVRIRKFSSKMGKWLDENI